DIKAKCCGCGRIIMMTRREFTKDVKKIIQSNAEGEK
ncbi:MAG: DUF951 domain-containing protein, partial [Clostridiales bacterium]|nr:DUF951 domain-containing protein [Clostridiales bacterium]